MTNKRTGNGSGKRRSPTGMTNKRANDNSNGNYNCKGSDNSYNEEGVGGRVIRVGVGVSRVRLSWPQAA
jgi:hypothetical protein